MDALYHTCSPAEFEETFGSLRAGIADTETYHRLGTTMLAVPEAARLADLDPFSPDYRAAVLDIYLGLRAHAANDYVPERDEASPGAVPANVYSQLTPWSFRDPTMLGENLYAWGHILRHLSLPPGGSVLEYGPGSGQLLLMLARMGYRACGVDVDAAYLEGIRLQAEGMGLSVPTERGVFGEGFGEERFDAIVFYEAFHHALDFLPLLLLLHSRLKPGGRLILCGEPIVEEPFPGIPYAWGPRLDALSVFCMRQYGWMELGFSHDFMMEAARRTGWRPSYHPFPGCGRAHIYVLQPFHDAGAELPLLSESPLPERRHTAYLTAELATAREALSGAHGRTLDGLKADLASMRASTSWRLTAPLRAVARLLGR